MSTETNRFSYNLLKAGSQEREFRRSVCRCIEFLECFLKIAGYS